MSYWIWWFDCICLFHFITVSVSVAAVNIALDNGDPKSLINCLQNEKLNLHSLTDQCAETYLTRLQAFKQSKESAGLSKYSRQNRLKKYCETFI